MPYLINFETLDPAQQYCSSNPRSRRRRLIHNTGVNDTGALDTLPADGAHFCHWGTFHGNDTDLARCAIVQILLNENRMSGYLNGLSIDAGSLDIRNRTFYNLQAISMESNGIGGTFPLWVTELPNLRIFRFSNNNISMSPHAYAAIVSMCERTGSNSVNCSGLPHNGGSCRAFGENAAMVRPYDSTCHLCEEPENVKSYWYLRLFLPVAVLFLIYIIMVYAYAQGAHNLRIIPNFLRPTATNVKGWVSCSCVIIVHYQSITLIGSARPIWPRSIQAYLGTPQPVNPTAQASLVS